MLFHEYLLSGFQNEAVILKYENSNFTLKDILNRCDIIRGTFHEGGIKKGERVILLIENGLNAICCQLTCSVIGAIYIPISPHEPVARIRQAIEKYKPAAVMVEDLQYGNNPEIDFTVSKVGEKVYRLSDKATDIDGTDDAVHENDSLYIISTSGTTGNPKGIVMSHKSTICIFKNIVEHCKLSTSDNVGTIAPLQFDLSLLDLGLAWGSKACISLFPQYLSYTPKKLLTAMIDYKVTYFSSVPAIWNIIIQYADNDIENLTTLKGIIYGGDKFMLQNMVHLRNKLPSLKIINAFGQSESIACTFFDIPLNFDFINNKNIPVGKGYPGSKFYLVNTENNELILENNVIGELWLSNDSLFDGYWQNDRLTNERLIPDMFDRFNTRKVFKSGDLFSRGSDGNYYFHGRKDTQVKVNGNRVELDEIEQLVLHMDGVADASAVGNKINDTTEIILFVSITPGSSIDEAEIRKHCRSILPQYMIPSRIIIYDNPLPLNTNGKVDKARLLTSLESI